MGLAVEKLAVEKPATGKPGAEKLSVEKLGRSFVARLGNIVANGAVDHATFAKVLDAFHAYQVLVLPRQEISPDDLVAFSRKFGPIEGHVHEQFALEGHPEIFCVGNYVVNGVEKAQFSRGLPGFPRWHTDGSHAAVPSLGSLFFAAIVPPEGGATGFLDASAAYEVLPEAMKRRIEGLRAVHSYPHLNELYRSVNPRRPPMTEAQKRAVPPRAQLIVQTHPETGRRSLYLNPMMTSHVEGMEEQAGRDLLDELMEHAQQERFIYWHQWSVGDLVIWDNRSVMHAASDYDEARYPRLMYRTTILGHA